VRATRLELIVRSYFGGLVLDQIQFVLKLIDYRQKLGTAFLTGHRCGKAFGAGNSIQQRENVTNKFGVIHLR
jgi:hypothetical protein